jgi:hypothetical protein
MVAWLMVSLKTQTSGPKPATFAPGHIDPGSCTEAVPASWAGPAMSQAPVSTAAPPPGSASGFHV